MCQIDGQKSSARQQWEFEKGNPIYLFLLQFVFAENIPKCQGFRVHLRMQWVLQKKFSKKYFDWIHNIFKEFVYQVQFKHFFMSRYGYCKFIIVFSYDIYAINKFTYVVDRSNIK